MGLEFSPLARRLKTPEAVQKFLRKLPYNRESRGETLRSAKQTLKAGEAHCLEATFVAAALLEGHGFPPTVLSLESKDGLDHVVYLFKGPKGWGSIARSRDEGLHGREPRFRSVKDLAMSYFDPYVDGKGRITGFAVASLDEMGADWRNSPLNVWRIEKYLIDLNHTLLKPSKALDARHDRALRLFQKKGAPTSGKYWW